MNLFRIYLIAILLVAFAACANGQETPKAVQVDEFGQLPCDDMLGRTDALAGDLHKEPKTIAAIVVHSPKGQPKLAENRRLLISSTLQLRGINKARFNFFLAGESVDGKIRTAFWKVPAGASGPIAESSRWNEEPPDISQTFMFDYEDEIGECPTYVPANFAWLLHQNPGSIGRVVIRNGGALVDRYWFAGQFIKELVENQGVPRNRLRLVFTKGRDMTAAEFWFVPARKK